MMIVITIIIWGMWITLEWMRNNYCLPLSKLVLTGEFRITTNDDIHQSISTLGSPGTFMTQNVNIIYQNIKKLSWIRKVSVRKQWPDKLKINLVEYIPLAQWNNSCMMDYRGNLFKIPINRIENLSIPMLYGPKYSEKDVLSGYLTMNEFLITSKFEIKTARMNTHHSWKLTLKNNIQLKIGRNNKKCRLQRFVNIYPVLLERARKDKKYINYVDLRYDSGLAVGWKY